MSKILLGLDGGAGKHIAATAAIRCMKEDGHDVDVICAHPHILQGHSGISRLYDWNRSEYTIEMMQQYDQIILDDPYRQRPFLQGDLNLAQTFCWMYDGRQVEMEDCLPDYYINKAEMEEVEAMLQGIEKPILVVQTNGGSGGGYSWTRDIPLKEAVTVLTALQEKYEIIHLRSSEQPEIQGVRHTADLNIRQAIAVLAMSQARLLIDSVYQHAAAALDLPSTVLWVATKPHQFGYDMHNNVLAHEPKLNHTYRLEHLFAGLDASSWKCPYEKDQNIMPIEQIAETFRINKV